MLPVLAAARTWPGATVTLLDTAAHLYYSGMVPEWLGGVYTRDEVRIDLAARCRAAGVRFVQATAATLDPVRRVVHTAKGHAVGYDLAAFDVGTRPPGHPEGTIPTKPLARIEALEARVAAVLADPEAALRLVVVGGGAAGVEILLNLTGRFAAHGRSADLAATLLEAGAALVPSFPPGLRRHAAATLRRRGVDVQTGARAAGVTGAGVALAGGPVLDADAVLWATGTTGPPLFAGTRLPTDRRGFVRVEPTLQVAGHPRLFAAGDCASVVGVRPLAKAGVHAVKQGPVLAANLGAACRRLRAGTLPDPDALARFTPYAAAPLILSTGTPTAWWTTGALWLRGRPLLRLKHGVDRRWMRAYTPVWQGRPLGAYLDAAAATTSGADRQP